MLREAILFFALSLFIFGCAAPIPVPTSPPSILPDSLPPVFLPDLTVSDISLSENGKVEVTIANIGEGPASQGMGNLLIYINGHLKWKGSLDAIPDQRFYQPGGMVRFTTPVEVVGRQKVQAVIEPEEGVIEKDGTNNIFVKELVKEEPKPPILLPDLTITDLFLTPKRQLVVNLVNIGEGPISLEGGNLKILVDDALKGSYTLGSLTDQAILPAKGSLSLVTPFTVMGRHEIHTHVDFSHVAKESNLENNSLTKILEGPPIGPDLMVKDFDLTEDLELVIVLANAGEVDLRKGVTLRVRITVNGQKISEFDHFISEGLKAHFGNRYPIDPPSRVTISGISKVKVMIAPKWVSDDVRLENNVHERTFIIVPFKIGPQLKEEFSFSFMPVRLISDGQTEKMKVEARWEGLGFPLKLSFKKQGGSQSLPILSGKSPLKVEFPISKEEISEKAVWRVFLSNPNDKKVEGHLIIQHP